MSYLSFCVGGRGVGVGVVAYSRLGAYSNKYGSRPMVFKFMIFHVMFHLYTNSAAPPYDT